MNPLQRALQKAIDDFVAKGILRLRTPEDDKPVEVTDPVCPGCFLRVPEICSGIAEDCARAVASPNRPRY